MTQFADILRLLVENRVEFIAIGGIAGVAHGLARTTYDVEVVYARNKENIARLVGCLGPFNPYPRGAPPGLPFQFDQETVGRGLNFTLQTSLGDLDLLGEVTGGGRYENLLPFSSPGRAFGVEFPCIHLDRLIVLKRAAGRPKDFDMISQLEALWEEQKKQQG